MHPYEQYENSDLWRVVTESIADLQSNNDIIITTNEKYVIGCICEKIASKLFEGKKDEKTL